MLSRDSSGAVLGVVNSCLSCEAQNFFLFQIWDRQVGNESLERTERGYSLTLGTPAWGTSVLMMREGLWGHLREASGMWEMIKGRQRNIKKHKGGRLVLGDTVCWRSWESGSKFLVTSDGQEGSCHQLPMLRAKNLQLDLGLSLCPGKSLKASEKPCDREEAWFWNFLILVAAVWHGNVSAWIENSPAKKSKEKGICKETCWPQM